MWSEDGADVTTADRVAATQNEEPRQPLLCSSLPSCAGGPFPTMPVWSICGSPLEGLHFSLLWLCLISAGELWWVSCRVSMFLHVDQSERADIQTQTDLDSSIETIGRSVC